jgi:hypothetical protein
VIPSTAAKEVEWATDNASIAIVNSAGVVSGLKPGTTWLRVHSVLKPSLGDSARVIVSDPVPAERVVFSKESTEVYLGGSAESLLVSVFPPKASQEVDFLVSRTGVLQLEKGWIRGLSVGEAMIIARAKEDAALSDTLKVRISPQQAIESVTLGKKAFTLFTGGEDLILAASIEPSGAVQEVQWRSGNPAVSTVTRGGKVTGMAPGRTRIYAISQADSTRQDSAEVLVKTDMPKLSVGRADTNVALGASVGILPVVASQEYGLVTIRPEP